MVGRETKNIENTTRVKTSDLYGDWEHGYSDSGGPVVHNVWANDG